MSDKLEKIKGISYIASTDTPQVGDVSPNSEIYTEDGWVKLALTDVKIDSQYIQKYFAEQAWILEIRSIHEEDKVVYTAKAVCGVQARGRYKEEGDSIEEALEKLYDIISVEWEAV